MNKIVFSIGILLLIIFPFLKEGIFTIDQTQQAIVLQFGELQKVYTSPGLKLKIPFIQEVILYEKRVLDLDSSNPVRVTSSDQKRLWVDSYTRYKIKDPVAFFKTVRPADEIGARSRLEVLISSSIRNTLGKVPLRSLLSEDRSLIMRQIQDEVSKLSYSLGIEIVDLRIIRAELPQENRNAVFARMNSELQRIAKENRAKGTEISQVIKAEADRECSVLLSLAKSEAEKIRGDGEAKAIEITSKSFSKDAKFYSFYKTLQLYQNSFNSNVTWVLSTNNDLMNLFNYHSQFKNR